jgi:hypothetical protein
MVTMDEMAEALWQEKGGAIVRRERRGATSLVSPSSHLCLHVASFFSSPPAPTSASLILFSIFAIVLVFHIPLSFFCYLICI